MPKTQPPIDEPASLVDARRVDQLCDAFEAAWRDGGRPSVEAFLAEAPASRRDEALRQLLLLDMEYRRRAGDTPVAEDYRERFGKGVAGLLEEPSVGRLSRAAVQVTCNQSKTALESRPTDGTAVPGYEILGELGRGGMGVVYKARQMKAGRVVALKMMLTGSHAGAGQRARFLTEVAAIARLQHPQIVQIHEVGEYHGWPFFSLEYCPGGSLEIKLRDAPLRPAEAAALVEQLARTMHAAHQKGVVHRDLKPANVLLGEDGTLKIADFGLAKMLDDIGSTVTGEVLGSPSYMAPEQASGRQRDIGPATDIYALGAILYECLTGRPPFKAATALETLEQVRGREPVTPRSLNPRTPRDLETICLRCLEKEPHRRYASALELAEDLGRFQAGVPIRARPPSAVRLAVHGLRRHPTLTAVILAGLVLAATITFVSVRHSRELSALVEGEQRAHREALANETQARRKEAEAHRFAYAFDVRVASQLVRNGDPSHVANLLDRHIPAAGAEDVRGFGWFHLRRFARSSLPPIKAHDGPTDFVAVSEDGELCVTATREGWVRVWEMSSGRCRQTFRCGGRTPPPVVLLPDGRTLAVVPPDHHGDVRLIDLATGQERFSLRHTTEKLNDPLQLSASGQTLVSVADREVRVWDTGTFQPRGRLNGGPCLVAPIANGGTLALAMRGDPRQLWLQDIYTDKARQRIPYDDRICSLICSPRGNFLAAGFHNGAADVFFRSDGKCLSPRFHVGPHNYGVMAFSADERWLAVAAPNEVQLWDVRDGTLCGRLPWQLSQVTALAFAPNGKVLAVGTIDGLLHRIPCDFLPSPDMLRGTLRPRGPLAVAHDGKTLAILDEDGAVQLIDAASGELRRTLPGHGRFIAGCAFSPDDRHLATAGIYDPELRLWDVASGELRKRWSTGVWGICCLAFAPRGDLVACGDYGGDVWIWNWVTGELRGRPAGIKNPIWHLAFAPDGKLLAGIDRFTGLRIWDIPLHGPLPVVPRETITWPEGVTALAFAPTGRTLTFGEVSGKVCCLEVPDTGPCRLAGPGPFSVGHPVFSLAYAPDGRTILANHRRDKRYDDLNLVWEPASGRLCQSIRHADVEPAGRGWMPDGRLVLSSRGNVHILDRATASVRVLPGQAPWPVKSLAFSADGKSLLLGTEAPIDEICTHVHVPALPGVFTASEIRYDYKCKFDIADAVRVWNVDTLTPGPRLPGEESLAPPERVALSPDGRILAAGSPDGSIRLWDLPGRRLLARFFLSEQARRYALWCETALRSRTKPEYDQESEGVQALAFSPDQRWLVAGGLRGTVTLWDTKDWREHRPVEPFPERIAWVGFSPASMLAVACRGQVRLYDPQTGLLSATLGAESDPAVLGGSFAPDGALLAVGSERQTIRVWDLGTREPRAVLAGHTHHVHAVAFSPDGKTLASADDSGVVKLWSTAILQETATLEEFKGIVRCLGFSPDGTVLAAGGYDGEGIGKVLLWRAPRP